MRKGILLLAILTATSLTACAQTANENKTTTATTKKEIKKMKVTELTAGDFQKKVMDYEKHPQEWVFEGDKPAVIDFYATWCGPCKGMAPVVDRLAEEYDGKVDFYKVDVDKEPILATLFGIRSIPTFIFIPKKGKPEIKVGGMSSQQFKEDIENTLKK